MTARRPRPRPAKAPAQPPSEAALERDVGRELFELASVPYAILDRAGTIERANLAFANLFGVPRGRFFGASLAKHVPPRERARLAEAIEDAIASDQKVRRDMILRGPHRGAIHAEVEVVGVGPPSDRRALLAIFDVTERARFEAEIGRTAKLLRLGRLAAEISHDFNNVLLGIIGCADLALDQLDSRHQAQGSVLDLKAAAIRGAKLTGKLLATGHPDDAPEHTELVSALAQCEPVLRGLLGDRITLTIRSPQGPVEVRVPHVEIEQILLNLAMNSRRAIADRGHLSIEISPMVLGAREARSSSPLRDGRYVTLQVEDDGRGMDAATRERAFEPFFSGSAGGFGLGLATVRAIIDRRGGHVDCRSEVGRGTTIRMLLPVADDRDAARPSSRTGPISISPSSAPPSSRPSLPPTSTVTVLVVEDDDLSRRAIATYLERRGYRVLAAANGVQAVGLSTGEGGRLDVIVTDMGLEGTTGDRLAAALRSMHRGASVIFVSGRPATDPAVKRALRAPRSAFLRKPFELDDLAAQISAFVFRQQLAFKPTKDPQDA